MDSIRLTFFLIGYLHPDGKNRIHELRYTIFRLREQELQEYSNRHHTEAPASARLFISFKYEAGVTAPGLPTRVDRHLPLLCPFEENQKPCGCCGHPKVASIRFHDCLLQHGTLQPQITSIFPRVVDHKEPYDAFSALSHSRLRETPAQHQVLELIAELIAGTSVSMTLASSPNFYHTICSLVHLGQIHYTSPIRDLVPIITRQKLSCTIQRKSQESYTSLYNQITDEYVSVMFDSSSINYTKYLAVTVVKNCSNSTPLFFRLVKSPMDAISYNDCVYELLLLLGRYNVQVTAICTDGLPAQVQGIKAMIEKIRRAPSLYLEDPFMAPIHIPCFNHRVNLVLVHSMQQSKFVAMVVADLRRFSAAAACTDYQTILQKHCPVFIPTRWLSLSCICSYVRMKRHVILANNYLTLDSIRSILRFELLLTPLFELHLFLEREQTKLHEVFPAILRAILQYELIMNCRPLSSPDWCYAIFIIVRNLIELTLSGSTGNLIALAFSLTPVGTYLFQQRRFGSGFNPTKPILESAEVLFFLFFHSSCRFSLFS